MLRKYQLFSFIGLDYRVYNTNSTIRRLVNNALIGIAINALDLLSSTSCANNYRYLIQNGCTKG